MRDFLKKKFKVSKLKQNLIILFILLFVLTPLFPVLAEETDDTTQETIEEQSTQEEGTGEKNNNDEGSQEPAAEEASAATSTEALVQSQGSGEDGEIEDESSEGSGEESQSGTDGQGDNATSTTVIDTGDATGIAELENEVNTNEVETENECEDPCEDPCDESCMLSATSTETNINNDNEADVDNEVIGDGNSGDNSASENEGNAIISTGAIDILVNIINFINTNIVGAGWNFILNITDGFDGDLNLSDLLNNNVGGAVNVENNNAANSNNQVTITANSGGNEANDNGGSVNISTGDINVATNIVNVVNTNIVNSNWMLAVVNVWNDWAGDIVLPGQRLDVRLGSLPAQENILDVENNNEAEVTNEVNINGNSGANTASGISEALITTGAVTVNNQIINQVNTNLVNTQWLNATVNIFGNWFGYVLGLDEQANYSETDNQVIISLSDADSELPQGTSFLSISNNNDAVVENEVNIDANTGENTANGNGGEATINTGDINALANIFNIVNTNVIGGEWILTLVNVFGSWNGDLAFGRPDLLIEEEIHDYPEAVFPGDTLTYTFKYQNNGDSRAVDVAIIDRYDTNYLTVANGNGGEILGGGFIEWQLPDIEPGEKGSVSYSLALKNNLPFGETELSNEVMISSYDKDRNYDNNASGGAVTVNRPHPYVIPMPGFIPYANFNTAVFWPAFTINKMHHTNGPIAFVGDELEYTITIKNTGSGDGFDVLLIDDMVDRTGKVVNSQGWDLGRVYAGEKIIVDYSIVLSPDALTGLYENTAQVLFFNEHGDELASDIAKSEIFILGGLADPLDKPPQLPLEEEPEEQLNPAPAIQVSDNTTERILELEDESGTLALPVIKAALAAEEEPRPEDDEPPAQEPTPTVLGVTIAKEEPSIVSSVFLLLKLVKSLAFSLF